MFIRHNILWILWSICIIGLCLTPGKELPHFEWNQILSLDKITHVFVYALLSVLMLTGFNKQFQYQKLREKAIYIVLIYSLVLGVSLELTQHYFIIDRAFEWTDIIANIVGTFVGGYTFFLIYRKCLIRN